MMETTMNKWIIIYLMVVCLFFTSKGYSQSEAFFLGHAAGVGGRALSMGSAYLAISDDYSATLWNPAGLTQLRRMELFGSISHMEYLNEAGYAGISNIDKSTKTKPNSIGFAFPVPTYRGSLVLAVGYNVVRDFEEGFSFSYYIDSLGVQQDYIELEEGGMQNWVFSGAMEVTQNLSLGAALNLWRGNDDYHFNLYDQDVRNDYYYNNYTYDQQITTKFQGLNFKIGALYRFMRFFRFAATISTPFTLNAKEDWQESMNQVEDEDSPSENYEEVVGGSWDYGLKHPFVFSGGAVFTLLPNIVLSGDVEYTDWSQTRYTTEPPVGDKFYENLRLRELRPSKTFRLGGEFTVPLINLQLRAGAIRQESPLKNATEKDDRTYVTVGAGLLLDKQVKFDVALLHGWWERDGSYISDDLPAVSEKITLDKIFGTISIRF